jgi:TolA-binding protein
MKCLSFKVPLLAGLLVLCGAPTDSFAQADPNQAAAQALDLYNAGRTKDAAEAYAQLLQDFPTAPVVPEAQFRLGYLDYLLGDFDKGIDILNKVLNPASPPELQEMASALLPQLMSAKAGKLPAKSAEQTQAFEAAIKQCDVYLQKYPKGDEVESVTYTRALASYQLEKFADAAAALRRNLAQFPTSETILDSQYLLALTLSTQANLALRGEDAAAKQAVTGQMAEAQRLFAEIVSKNTDIALANDAAFQLGESFMNLAGFSAKDDKPPLYQKAITAYRLVQDKESMIRAQQERLTALLGRMRQAAGDRVQLRRLQSLQQREQIKLAQIQSGPDQTVAATIKVGEIFFFEDQPNAARVVFHQMLPFAETDDEKKQILYYTTLTYAVQNLTEPAVKAYDDFQAKYKGDAIAENLPYVMGTMFLNSDPAVYNPEKALAYLREALTIYPHDQFTPEILAQQATALTQLKRFDEAQGVYKQFLATNPKPALAAVAEFGLGEIDRNTNKLDDALTQYKKVRDNYGSSPQAEQAAFWIAQVTLQKGDPKSALAGFDAFLSKYPNSQLVPTVMFTEATAYVALAEQAKTSHNPQEVTENQAKALQSFKTVADKYPKSEVAPFAYFQMAQLYAGEQKSAEMLGVMKDFIAKYPDSDKLFYAYDSLGQAQIAAGKITDAIATYLEMVGQHPKNPLADQALYKAADLSRQLADSQGRYLALNDDQRKTWTKGLNDSIADCEQLVQNYPESQSVALALQTLLKDQQMFLDAQVKNAAQVEQYFTDLAAKCADQPAAKSKVLFTLASFLYDKDQAKALAQMKAAYDPKLVYAPADLDLFGSALIDSGKNDEALQVYQKLAADYPNPPGDPSKAPPLVQEAQATALYGQGHALQLQGKIAEATKLFDRLKVLYPWSPKLLEATYGIALSEFQQKQYDDAATKLVAIIRATNATVQLRADAMLLSAKIQEAKGNLDDAIDQYAKIATFYQSVSADASEGLWKAAQLIEQQADRITDPAKKAAQLAKAKAFYQQLTTDYPDSPHAAEAKTHAGTP